MHRPIRPRVSALLPCVFLAATFLAGCDRAQTPVVAADPTVKAVAEPPKGLPPISKHTRDMRRAAGLLPLHVDAKSARLFVELPAPGPDGIAAEMLYVESLASGLGSNPVGLDRGQLGEARVVQFRRVGRRLLVEAPNLDFRAHSNDADERRAVAQSFATSILWAGDVVAEEKDGRFLVDFTSFAVRDAHEVAGTLKRTQQGDWALDLKRSVFDPSSALAFPDNVEFEARLTFQSAQPGPLASSVTPMPRAVTLVQHHSLVRLPDDGYRPRAFDARMGSWAIGFADYATPLDQPLRQRWIGRHRLEKVNPGAAPSRVENPIVYYVDRGAPEPVRQALIDGASWWAEAFERAGFVDAFRVELLPEDAHPLDVRYDVIQWVHRSTRGWSYGGGVVDPRTGEILKGHVSLGSLRVRQDRMIFEGLLGTAKTGSGDADDPVELALARIRQLSAHEVGHTLGLTHNFAASTYAGRASVMDYPAPLVLPAEDGGLDASSAYATGIGEWDAWAIRWAYAEFDEGEDEAQALDTIVREGQARGYEFITDHDARPAGGAHPRAHLWDNGENPVAALRSTLEVRKRAIESFGADRLAADQPRALLHEVFVPLYFHHRYQTEAAVKWVGGVDYDYARNDASAAPVQPLDPRRQREALRAVLATLEPAVLDVPERVLQLLSPRPFGYGAGSDPGSELMSGDTDPLFDALGAAATAADMSVRLLLHPARCARLVDQHRRDESRLSLEEAIDQLLTRVFEGDDGSARLRAVRHVLQRVVADRLMERAVDDSTSAAVRAVFEDRLERLRQECWQRADRGGVEGPHYRLLAGDLQRFLDDREWKGPSGWRPAPAPPGSPIGDPALGCGWRFGG